MAEAPGGDGAAAGQGDPPKVACREAPCSSSTAALPAPRWPRSQAGSRPDAVSTGPHRHAAPKGPAAVRGERGTHQLPGNPHGWQGTLLAQGHCAGCHSRDRGAPAGTATPSCPAKALQQSWSPTGNTSRNLRGLPTATSGARVRDPEREVSPGEEAGGLRLLLHTPQKMPEQHRSRARGQDAGAAGAGPCPKPAWPGQSLTARCLLCLGTSAWLGSYPRPPHPAPSLLRGGEAPLKR